MKYGPRVGKVESYILDRLERESVLHMTLIDPDKTTGKEAARIAQEAERAGTAAIMVGGSLGVSERLADEVVKQIKKHVNIPVILFPGEPGGLSRYADAVWFLSVLNSSNPYYIVDAQIRGAIIIRKYGLEPIPLAYIILGEGGAAGFVSQARVIPFNRPELVAAYSLAAEMMGFRFIYLEGGSGGHPVPQDLISRVRRIVNVPLVVGGGIRNGRLAEAAARAGADIIVTGTVVENVSDVHGVLREIVVGAKKGAMLRSVKMV